MQYDTIAEFRKESLHIARVPLFGKGKDSFYQSVGTGFRPYDSYTSEMRIRKLCGILYASFDLWLSLLGCFFVCFFCDILQPMLQEMAPYFHDIPLCFDSLWLPGSG